MLNIQLGTHLRSGKAVAIDSKKLTEHVVILGKTGSGKSGIVLSLAEQLSAGRIPLIVVDIKGDMANLALQPLHIRIGMNLRILTPGGTHGEQINLFSNLQKPDRIKNTVSQILKMVRVKDTNPLSSRQHSYLSKLLHYFHSHGTEVDLPTLITGVCDPPFRSFGALPLDDAFPATSRNALAAKLNNLFVAPSFEKWRNGIDLDVDTFFDSVKGKANITIYSVAHLDEDEKLFALALLFDKLESWMRRQPGTGELRAELLIDECSDLIPPHPRKPVTKTSLMTMLKQARAYGLGLVLASQNTMDLDYKAMSNCDTWIVGALKTRNDRARVVEAIATKTVHDRLRLEHRISNLGPREFVLCRPKSTVDFKSIDVTANMIGPMTPMEISKLLSEDITKLWAILGDLNEGK